MIFIIHLILFNMPFSTIVIIMIVGFVIMWIFLVKKFSKKVTKLTPQKKAHFNKLHKRIMVNKSYKEKIIDLDKLLHKILLEIWYSWTFWEILKQEPKEVINLNTVWEIHKLRNKLVHDFDLMTSNVLKKKWETYSKEIQKILKKL